MPAGRFTPRLLPLAVIAAAGALAAAQSTAPTPGAPSAAALTQPAAPPVAPATPPLQTMPTPAAAPPSSTVQKPPAPPPTAPHPATPATGAPPATQMVPPRLPAEKPLAAPPTPAPATQPAAGQKAPPEGGHGGTYQLDFTSMLFVFMLATFIGIGVIRRVSRLLHTPLMSLTNAISAIAVVGSILVTGGQQYGTGVRILGAIALFCSMTNIISGFLITDRMLKMFKTREGGKA